jgi:hypothetical protein
MKEITKKDMTSSIGLILMFALGWIANGLVDKLTSDDNSMDSRYEQRMERMQYMEMPRNNSWRQEDRNREEMTRQRRNRQKQEQM